MKNKLKFVWFYISVNTKKRPQSYELTAGSSFEPSYVYKMLHMIESTMSFKVSWKNKFSPNL